MNKFKYLVLHLLCLANVSLSSAASLTPEDVVYAFGVLMNRWCETGKHALREDIESLCNGVKKCRVEDKIHADYQTKKGLRDYDTFVLDSYLNMFHTEMKNGLRYKISEIEVCAEDEMSEGQKLSFITATVDISGPVNKQVKDLFLIRDDKISGIYSYDSQLGFSHLNGSLIKELEFGGYKWTNGFVNGFAIVANSIGKTGLIDIKGNVIIPCIWDGVDYKGGEFARGYNYKENHDNALYDLRYNGKELPLTGRIIDYFKNRKKEIGNFFDGYAVIVNSEGKYGFLKEVDLNYNVDFIYDEASRFSDGYACVTKDGRELLINRDYQINDLINSRDYHLVDGPQEGLLRVMDRNTGKWGFMNLGGFIDIPCIFDEVSSFHEGIAYVKMKDVPSREKYYETFHTALVSMNDYEIGKERRERKGNFNPQFIYEQSLGKFEDGYIEMLKTVDGKRKGSLVGRNKLPLKGFNWEYDNIRSFSDGLALCYKNDKAGYLNRNGELVIPLIYDIGKGFNNGIASVGIRKEGKTKYGAINKDGVTVVPFIYDDPFVFNNGIALVNKDGQVGLIDAFGNSTFLLK